jgi:hypothetical protein
MTTTKDAWSDFIKNHTVENLERLGNAFKKAGASWINFSEMKKPMPKQFATDYLCSKKSKDDLEKMLKKDFSTGGKYYNLLNGENKEAA